MKEETLYLGDKDGERVYLTKHKWDCDWYWAFGYLGNKNNHFHISSLIDHPAGYEPDWTDVDHHFDATWINQERWWILRDLFITAYRLKDAAAAYRYGGHQCDQAKLYRVTCPEMARKINVDLECVLTNIWNLLQEWKP